MNKPAAQLDTMNVSQDTHPMAELLRMDRMPHIWCSSCGLGTGLTCFIMALRDTGIPEDKLWRGTGLGLLTHSASSRSTEEGRESKVGSETLNREMEEGQDVASGEMSPGSIGSINRRTPASTSILRFGERAPIRVTRSFLSTVKT